MQHYPSFFEIFMTLTELDNSTPRARALQSGEKSTLNGLSSSTLARIVFRVPPSLASSFVLHKMTLLSSHDTDARYLPFELKLMSDISLEWA